MATKKGAAKAPALSKTKIPEEIRIDYMVASGVSAETARWLCGRTRDFLLYTEFDIQHWDKEERIYTLPLLLWQSRLSEIEYENAKAIRKEYGNFAMIEWVFTTCGLFLCWKRLIVPQPTGEETLLALAAESGLEWIVFNG